MSGPFKRSMRIKTTGIKTIEDVNNLKQKCARYLELDKDIFEEEDPEVPLQRSYSFRVDIKLDSFKIYIEMQINDIYNWATNLLEIDYDNSYWQNLAIVVNTLPTTLDKVQEFCKLHQEIFGVPTDFTDYMFTMPDTKKVFRITFNTCPIDETTVHSQN